MKCIKTLEGITGRKSKVLRVVDAEAQARVISGEAVYVPKTEWKKSRPCKSKSEICIVQEEKEEKCNSTIS